VNSIIANIKTGRVASIEIHYDANQAQAMQLVNVIETETGLTVRLIQESPLNSPSITFKYHQVSVIVRSS
jgi:endonuclease G, mitochondrial